jgi:hypothetical protein
MEEKPQSPPPPPNRIILILHGDIHYGAVLDFLSTLSVKVKEKFKAYVPPSELITHVAGSGNLRYGIHYVSDLLFICSSVLSLLLADAMEYSALKELVDAIEAQNDMLSQGPLSLSWLDALCTLKRKLVGSCKNRPLIRDGSFTENTENRVRPEA